MLEISMDNMQIEYGNEQANIRSDVGQYWASTALVKLCGRRQAESASYNLTKLLLTQQSSLSLTERRRTMESMTGGGGGNDKLVPQKVYRSKKHTLMTLKRRFSEETLKKLAHKHKFKRSWSCNTGMDGTSGSRRVPELTEDVIRENAALSEHLGKLTELVQNVGSLWESNRGRNIFYRVVCPRVAVDPQKPVPPTSKQSTFMASTNFVNPTDIPEKDYFDMTAYESNYVSTSSIYNDTDEPSSPQPEFCSYPSSPVCPIYPLDTYLSASAPDFRDFRPYIANLRTSTTEQLKSSFENIKVGDCGDDEVFSSL